ncbi:glycosyltransferase [Mesorhizobium koreense]|jgi:glycosyltransferase involved in cell wall biosynthesis|uniref:glycosyltransferase n=1 Tax=Mesorhizobium koreense TaxID=3074855 RepID=UPI00287B9C35|nr:glycosyltransferase [Mesorhizobium sp. WR6]
MTQRASPQISVIVPYLNQPEHLANCLRSLMQQTYDLENVEIIVVDNGSRELPEAICAQFDNVRLIQELTPGPGPARNRGVSVSRALLLAFIDADCIADKNWLSVIASAFTDPRAEIIGGDVRIALANPARMTMLEAYESIYAYRQQEYIERQGFSGTGNLALRRDIYDNVGPFAGIDVAEDREWGHRAGLGGHVIYYLPEMIVYHPARRSLSELRTKWRRHVAHDYAEHVHGPLDRTRWAAKAFVLALSPVGEIIKIARSDRVGTIHDRVLAFVALSQIRIYRSWRVLSAVLIKNARASQMWNR